MTFVSAVRSSPAVDLLLAIGGFLVVRGTLTMFEVPKPASIAVVVTLVVATVRLRQQRIGWRELGFARPRSTGAVFVIALAAYFTVAASVALIVNPLSDWLGWPAQAFGKLGPLEGNLPYFLFMVVVIGWGAAAFGEELLFRGLILHRLHTLLGCRAWSLPVAIVGQALLFGLGHMYQGLRGAATATAVGLVLGAFFPIAGRNLWPLIVSHGLIDTIGLYAIYAGLAEQA